MARKVALTTIILAVVLVCASCGGSDSGPVSFLVFGDPEELPAFRDVGAAYAQ